ncbi:MAG: aspartate kinase [Methanomassiliicoccales archaeon]
MKFGGSCLKDAEGIRKAADIASAQSECISVVSAVSGVTDTIVKFISRRMSERSISAFVSSVVRRHTDIIRSVCNSEISLKYTQDIKQQMESFERLLYGVYYTGELTERMKALLMSFGERLSVRVMAAALEEKGMKPFIVETDKSGILTDNNFQNATADLVASRRQLSPKLKKALSRNLHPVVTGFFASSRDGRVTLLGRNGTDYSASIIAYAVSAEKLVLWKDVNGFQTADPDIVPSSKLIEELSYEEASELSYFGANVMHPRAVEPARLGKIKIEIRNIASPDRLGTLVMSSYRRSSGIVKSVSCLPGLGIVRVFVSGGGFQAGALSRLSGFLGSAGVNIISATTSQTCIAFLLREEDIRRAVVALEPLVPISVSRVETAHGIALLCLVGLGLGETRGIAAKVFSAISGVGINVGMMSAGASTAAYHFTVKERDMKAAVKAAHDAFFG